jgi:phage tail tube protein FII
MKSIKTLIKLSKQQLDEQRRTLVEKQKQKEQLLEYSKMMADELKVEEEFAAKNPELSITFDSYRKSIMEKQFNIRMGVDDLDKQMIYITNKITELFGEVKRYEIVLEQQTLRELKERQDKENKILDEIGLNNYNKQ